jgi:hypothetical protein
MRKNPSRGFILLVAIVCISLLVVLLSFFRQESVEQKSDFTSAPVETPGTPHIPDAGEKTVSSLPDQAAEPPVPLAESQPAAPPVLPGEPSREGPVQVAEAVDEGTVPVAEEEVPPVAPDREARKLPPEIKEKLSISYGEEQEFYTIQAATYKGPQSADHGYELLEKGLRGDDRNLLRIEKVGAYFSVRLGRAERVAPLQDLLARVQGIFPSALIISAFIKDERIVKAFSAAPHEDILAVQEEISKAEEEKIVEETEKSAVIPEKDVPESEPDKLTGEEPPSEEEVEIATLEIQSPEITDTKTTRWLRDQLSMDPVTMILKDDQGRNLAYPGSVFYDRSAKELYVVNGRQGRVVVFRSDYLPDVSLGTGRGVNLAVSGAVDKEGNIYICQQRTDEKPARVTRLNAAFFITDEIVFDNIEGLEGFNPQRIAIGIDGNIYIAGDIPGVLVFHRDLQFAHRLIPEEVPAAGRRKGAKPVPVMIKDIAIDGSGRIYLLSEDISRIFVYDQAENFLYAFGEKGGISGKLSRPRGIAVDDERGLVFVVDYMRHSLLAYSIIGEYITEFGGRGAGPGWFNFPTDIETGLSGNVFVTDFFNDRVQVLAVHEKRDVLE